MEKMTMDDERKLVTAVREALYYTEQGLAPDESIVKVAEARDLLPEQVRRVVEAFNVNATLKHFKSASGEQRADTFPTADADKVLGMLKPEKLATPGEKAASIWTPGDEAYLETSSFVEPELPALAEPRRTRTADMSAGDAMTTVMSDYAGVKAAAARAEADLDVAYEALAEAVDKVAECFTAIDADPSVLPEDFRMVVTDMVPALRVAGVTAHTSQWPARYAKAAEAREAYIQAGKRYADASEELRESGELLEARVEKLAGFTGGIVGGAIGNAVMADALDVPGSEAANAKIRGMLEDPEHLATRRGLQAQVMLKDFMSTDDVLRHAKQDEVLRAYNDIAQLAPTVAQQPMVMRGWMRKVVESRGLDPFDIHELVKTERSLRPAAGDGKERDKGGDR